MQIDTQLLIYFLGIMGTLLAIAWRGSGLFSAIETSVDWLKDRVKDLKIDIDNVRDKAFKSSSPVALTEKGTEWLLQSGLKEYIDSHKDGLLEACSGKKDTNAYEVQEHVFNLFDKMEFEKSVDDRLKQYAYEQGISMEVLRRIGAVYFRDICLEYFHMNPGDIDSKAKS